MALQRASSNNAMHQRNPPQTHDQKMVKKCPWLSRKQDGENPRTNTATHQKKCPRFPKNTMEKTQGPTLLRFEKTTKKRPHYLENRMEKTQKNNGENHTKTLCSIRRVHAGLCWSIGGEGHRQKFGIK